MVSTPTQHCATSTTSITFSHQTFWPVWGLRGCWRGINIIISGSYVSTLLFLNMQSYFKVSPICMFTTPHAWLCRNWPAYFGLNVGARRCCPLWCESEYGIELFWHTLTVGIFLYHQKKSGTFSAVPSLIPQLTANASPLLTLGGRRGGGKIVRKKKKKRQMIGWINYNPIYYNPISLVSVLEWTALTKTTLFYFTSI
mgnify:CR=1 FL=1